MASLDLDTDIKIYLTGAGSDGGAQTDPAASLGNFRSSTEFVNDSDLNLFPRITAAQAAAGYTAYLALCLKNENGGGTPDADGLNFKVWFYEPAGTLTTAGYAASGAVTVALTSAADFDTSGGYCENTDTNVIMYYDSITGLNMSVPSTGRAARGSGAALGSSAETIRPYPWADLCTEINGANKTAGAIQTIGSITTAPTLDSDTHGSWATPVYTSDSDGYSNGIDIDHNSYGTDLLDGYLAFVWFRFVVDAGTLRNPSFDLSKFRMGCEN